VAIVLQLLRRYDRAVEQRKFHTSSDRQKLCRFVVHSLELSGRKSEHAAGWPGCFLLV